MFKEDGMDGSDDDDDDARLHAWSVPLKTGTGRKYIG